MANNQQFMEGKTITTALSAAMASGQLTAIGKMVGVANLTTAANEANVYSVEGVFLVPKKKTDDVTVGALLYLDADGKSVTTTAGTQYVGVAWAAAANGVETVPVRINFAAPDAAAAAAAVASPAGDQA